MPELPIERLKRYKDIHKLSDHISIILVNNKKISDFYEESIKLYNSPKEISNWIINELLSKNNDENEEKVESNDNNLFSSNRVFNTPVTPQQIADIAKLVEESSINRNTAKDIFNKSIRTGESPLKISETIKVEKIKDPYLLTKYINDILNNEKHLVEQSVTNPNVNNFILGKIMKKTSGRADPQITLKLIKDLLEKEKWINDDVYFKCIEISFFFNYNIEYIIFLTKSYYLELINKSKCFIINGRKDPISVTMPIACVVPLSSSLVTTGWFISTAITFTDAGIILPTAIE